MVTLGGFIPLEIYQGSITYPTKREIPKIIDSNMPWGWGYVSSQENAHKLFVHIPTKKKHLEEKSKVEASNPEESEEMPPARSSWCLL